MQKNFFAVDLGATSGRTILATYDGKSISMKEVTRFANPMIPLGGHLYWDIAGLYNEVLNGLRKVAEDGISIDSIGIDTWGVDFGLLRKDGTLVENPVHYRDKRNSGMIEKAEEYISREKMYDITGIQFMDFNTIFQLLSLKENRPYILDEAETMFHEFGHGLHGLLAKANYVSVSGTNVSRDFVELPSQIMENWAFEPEVLAMYAKHYQTGELIPNEIIEKINASATFNQGFMTTELTAAAILDMNWHDLKSVEGITDPIAFEKEMMDKIGLIPEIAPRYRTTYFNHIWAGGYSAGYYSYLWAEVLDKDAYALFKEKGIFDQETAQKFRTLLEKGGTEDPMELYRTFRGAEPNPEAMLIGRGLK